jgi:hypothetical protein
VQAAGVSVRVEVARITGLVRSTTSGLPLMKVMIWSSLVAAVSVAVMPWPSAL